MGSWGRHRTRRRCRCRRRGRPQRWAVLVGCRRNGAAVHQRLPVGATRGVRCMDPPLGPADAAPALSDNRTMGNARYTVFRVTEADGGPYTPTTTSGGSRTSANACSLTWSGWSGPSPPGCGCSLRPRPTGGSAAAAGPRARMTDRRVSTGTRLRALMPRGRHVGGQLGHRGGVLANAQPQLPIWQPYQSRRNRLASAALHQQHQRVLHPVAVVGPWFTQRLAHVPTMYPLAQHHPVQLASCGGQDRRGGSVTLLQLGQDPGE